MEVDNDAETVYNDSVDVTSQVYSEDQDAEEHDDTDIEEALTDLTRYDNLTQLTMLKKEINHMAIHNIQPTEGWYDDRLPYIRQYSQLNWYDFINKFKGKDDYMHDTSYRIIQMCTELIEESSTRPSFNLNTYYRLIHEIACIWKYYHLMYMGDEEDTDIIDLIEGITHLSH